MDETKPSSSLPYPNAKAWVETSAKNWTESHAEAWSKTHEQNISIRILSNNKLNNNVKIIKDFRNYHETENQNYDRKLS